MKRWHPVQSNGKLPQMLAVEMVAQEQQRPWAVLDRMSALQRVVLGRLDPQRPARLRLV
jgi:hypothetical protein